MHRCRPGSTVDLDARTATPGKQFRLSACQHRCWRKINGGRRCSPSPVDKERSSHDGGMDAQHGPLLPAFAGTIIC